jgi:hypothetical protein
VRNALVLAIVLVLAQPLAGAWGVAGTSEPDTTYDAQSGRMWNAPDTTPDTLGVRQVYFDAFPMEYPLAVNPNSGTLGSRLALAPNVHYGAVLGVWKDCNADGFIGEADNGLLVYRHELLQRHDICPVSQRAQAFDDGSWVRELLAIGRPDPCVWSQSCSPASSFTPDPWVLYSNRTVVWGDLGLPGQAPPAGDCPTFRFPTGTTSGTGYLLAYADCFDEGGLLTLFDDVDAAVDPSNSQQLAFEDPRHPQSSSSRLNQPFPVTPYGNPQTGQHGLLQQDAHDDAYHVWDCQAGTQPEYDHPQLDPTHPTPTRTLNPSVNDTTGSYWDSTVDLEEAMQGDCDPSTNNTLRANYALIALEDPAARLPGAIARTRPDILLEFTEAARGLAPAVDPTLGSADWPPDLGLTATSMQSGPIWSGTSWYVGNGPRLVRADLKSPLDGALYTTFYAYVSPDDLVQDQMSVPNRAMATYGAEACGSFTTGVHGGWDCNAGDWWRGGDGSDVRPTFQGGGSPAPVVGDPYDLVDVDCQDGKVTSTAAGDVYASLAPESEAGTCS